MESIVELIKGFFEDVGKAPGALEYSLLGLGATLEYVFPPFPGDVLVLLGAFLVGKYGWSVVAVMAAVTLGSALGLSADYAFGRWVARRDQAWRAKYRTWGRMGNAIDRFDAVYRRWGPLCILFNRFVPAVRAVFFVGAGMARIPYGLVLALGLVSAVAWNLLILWVGVSVGSNWDRLRGFLSTYSTVAWCIAGASVVGLVVYLIRRKRSARGT